MRVVADTNVLISAFLFGGLPQAFLDLSLFGTHTLITSDALLDELDEKLRGKLAVPEAKRSDLSLSSSATQELYTHRLFWMLFLAIRMTIGCWSALSPARQIAL